MMERKYIIASVPSQWSAMMEISDFKVAPMLARDVWRSATVKHGAQSAMISGAMWMLAWPAINLAMQLLVSQVSSMIQHMLKLWKLRPVATIIWPELKVL